MKHKKKLRHEQSIKPKLLAKWIRLTPLSFQELNTAQRPCRLNWLLAKVHIPRWMSTNSTMCLAVASLLALSGCTAVKVKLGMRIYLAKTSVAAAGAEEAPGVWEHPTEATEATAPVDEMVLMGRRGGVGASP